MQQATLNGVYSMHRIFRSFHTHSLWYLAICVATVYALTLYPYHFFQRNNVSFTTTGLTFAQPSTAYTLHPHEALSYLYQFTFLLHLTPETDEPGHSVRIMCSGKDFATQNFSIGQWHSHLNVQFFNRESKQFNELTIPDVFKAKRPMWIALTFNGTTVRCYIDGIKRGERKTGPMALTQWDSTYAIVFGTDPAGKQQWEGILYTAAIFDRAFKSADLIHPDLILRKYSSIIHYEFGRGPYSLLPSSGTDRDSLFVPELFKPFNRSTLFDSFQLLGRQRLYIRDIVANIFFFLPVGFFSALALRRMVHPFIAAAALSVLIGLALSLSVEYAQIFLPSRFSSMIDVVTNTAGTAVGCCLSLFFKAHAPRA